MVSQLPPRSRLAAAIVIMGAAETLAAANRERGGNWLTMTTVQ